MQISDKLSAQLKKAVEVSMRIEGYPPERLQRVKEEAKKLMEAQRVQVSLPRK